MSSSIKTYYNKSKKIFYKEYYGDLYVEDVINSWNKIFENNELELDFIGILVDLRKSNIRMTLEESSKIPEYYQKNIKIFGNKKIGYLTNNPQKTVYSMLVEEKDKGYKTKTFSSIEALEFWLLH